MENVTQTPVQIIANFDNTIDWKEILFKFRARSTKVVDEAGNPVMEVKDGKEVQQVIERPSREIKLNLPVLSVEGIIKALEIGGKGLEFLLDVVAEVVADRARDLLEEDETLTEENFPFDQLGWEALANLPKEVRRGSSTIAKEDWDAFADAYSEFMVSVGVKKEAVARQASVFKQKLRPIATRKDVLPQFALLLKIFLEKSPTAGDHTGVIEYLMKTNKKYMEQEAKSAADMYGLDALSTLATK